MSFFSFFTKCGLTSVTVLQRGQNEQIAKNRQRHWKEGSKLPLKRVFQTPELTFDNT